MLQKKNRQDFESCDMNVNQAAHVYNNRFFDAHALHTLPVWTSRKVSHYKYCAAPAVKGLRV